MRVTVNSKWWNFPQPRALLVGIPDTRARNRCRRENVTLLLLGTRLIHTQWSLWVASSMGYSMIISSSSIRTEGRWLASLYQWEKFWLKVRWMIVHPCLLVHLGDLWMLCPSASVKGLCLPQHWATSRQFLELLRSVSYFLEDVI